MLRYATTKEQKHRVDGCDMETESIRLRQSEENPSFLWIRPGKGSGNIGDYFIEVGLEHMLVSRLLLVDL